MNNNGLIYMYVAPNGKKYVGQTIHLEKRKQEHKNQACNPKCASYDCAFHRAIRKYGVDNFEFFILEDNIPRQLLDEKEIYWIQKMNSFGNDGYNMTVGGNGNLGRVWSEDQRKRLSEINKGKNVGHEVTAETRKKISEKNKGKSHPRSEETRRKISEHNTKAVRKRIMFVNSGTYHNKEFYPELTFESVKECADYFGVAINTMSNIKNGKYNKNANMKIVEITQ